MDGSVRNRMGQQKLTASLERIGQRGIGEHARWMGDKSGLEGYGRTGGWRGRRNASYETCHSEALDIGTVGVKSFGWRVKKSTNRLTDSIYLRFYAVDMRN